MDYDDDRLIDFLLEKTAGSEPRRSRAKEILAAAAKAPTQRAETARPRTRMRRAAWFLPLAAAASIVAAVGIAYWMRSASVDTLSGKHIVALTSPVTQELDDYCQITLDSNSSIVVGGGIKARKVLLESGNVSCSVAKHVGSFAIECELGTVTVHGTKFSTHLNGVRGSKGAAEDSARSLSVELIEGIVALATPWGGNTILSEEKGRPKYGAISSGILDDLSKVESDPWVSVIADDETEPVKYSVHDAGGQDRKELMQSIKLLYKRNRVRLIWFQTDSINLAAIAMVEPNTVSGSVSGSVIRKNERWIDIKPANGGIVERYTATNDIEMLRAVKIGDRVAIDWKFESHCKRVNSIRGEHD